MNDMRTMDYDNRSNRDGDYRDSDYRDYRDYRDDYNNRDYDFNTGRNNRDQYGRNRRDREYRTSYRDRYGRNYRSQEEYYNLMEDIVDDGMELARAYEDASEMTNNTAHKNKLMKIAEREKEHYKMAKEMLENRM